MADRPGGREAEATARRKLDTYVRLAVMVGLSLLWMYAAMFAMVNSLSDIYMNLNFFYMALLMAAPMGLLEILFMARMYPDRRWNFAIAGVSLVLVLFSFAAIRSQAAVGDEQFLESMIPHHSGAIQMCQESSIDDAEIRELCDRIIQGQAEEIEEMKAILERLE